MTLKQRTSSSIRLNNSYNNNLILKMSQKIRIKLKSYDHQLVDKSAEKIVKAVKATGAIVSGPIPLPTHKRIFTVNTVLSLTRSLASSSSSQISSVSLTSTAQQLRQLMP